MAFLCLSGAAPLRAETPAQDAAGGLFGGMPGDLKPVLIVDPREIDLGAIGPGGEVKGDFLLRNVGTGRLDWSTEGPEGWTRSGRQELAGVVEETPAPVTFHLFFLKEAGQEKAQSGLLVLRLEAGEASATFLREAQVGELREAIRFSSTGGTRTVFFRVRLSQLASAPMMALAPVRIDCGTVRAGEQITRMVHLTNRGREVLKWRVGLAGRRGMPATTRPLTGRYVSFLNEAVAGTGSYSPVGALREGMHLTGTWGEEGGYPSGREENDALRFRFTGSGISLFIWNSPEGGPLSVYIDGQFIAYISSFSERREREEISLTEWLPDGPHVLTLVNGEGRTVLEGVRVFGRPVMKGPPGWISVFPDSGTTLRETDYVNIGINVRNLEPGVYGERVFFLSNGGDADVEIFLEVAADAQPRFLDVYRYVAAGDYLYTTNPRAEAARLQTKGYRNQGIVFRLFSPGTPGTTAFFRWFNPVKGDHFYSSDQAGGGKPLSGYLAEGTIGNIATSRLTGTRELYRWHNPATGRHFYTTDQAGEGLAKKGYRFEGIAGFVR
ncbi:MAG: hypothetical protein KJ936_09160 [Proteobacteria bacterium]|nr:hypothetical protein [Pseudomonadota bacterium]